jgi:hypothetical protein
LGLSLSEGLGRIRWFECGAACGFGALYEKPSRWKHLARDCLGAAVALVLLDSIPERVVGVRVQANLLHIRVAGSADSRAFLRRTVPLTWVRAKVDHDSGQQNNQPADSGREAPSGGLPIE